MQNFILRSKFKPTGDQPQAIKKLVSNIKSGTRFQTLLGATGTGKTYVMAQVINQIRKPTLVISPNKTLAAQLASEFSYFFPKNSVCYFVSYYDFYQPEAYIPQTDTYIAKDAKINEEIDRLRHQATQSLITRRDVVVIASVSCIYNLGSPQNYQEIKLTLKSNQRIKRNDLLREFVELYYQRNDIDFHRGTFRVKGDIIDIFPSYSENDIIRIEFFGDRIEKIYQLNPIFGYSKKKLLSQVDLFPASHYLSQRKYLPFILDRIRDELKNRVVYFKSRKKFLETQRLIERTNFDLEMIREVGFCHGIENYSRYFDGRAPGQPPFTLIDYFPKDFLLIIDESHITIPQLQGMFFGDKSRKDALVEFGFRLPSAYDNRPLYFSEFEKKINQCIFTSATPGPYEIKKSCPKSYLRYRGAKVKGRKYIVEQLIRPTGILDPLIEVKPTKNQIDDLISQIQARVERKQRVLVTTLTKRMSEDLSSHLQEMGIKVHYLHSEIDTFKRLEILRDLRLGKYDVVVGINLLREGLDMPEVSLVAILDADKEGYLRSETALIQVAGRAARHVSGQVIMYADKITRSMQKAIQETKRRRSIQEKFNQRHGIVPRSIKKEIKEERLAGGKRKEIMLSGIKAIPKEEIGYLIKTLENQMEIASQNLEFEKAALIRDQIKELEKQKRLAYK